MIGEIGGPQEAEAAAPKGKGWTIRYDQY
jgi:hypothetical protein